MINVVQFGGRLNFRRSLSAASFLFAIVVLGSAPALAQAPAPASQSKEALAFLERAREGVQLYIDTFKDLTAEETTTVETFSLRGALQDKTTVVSTLVVYRAQQKPSVFAEYRVAESVDGHGIKDREQRVIKVWERLAKAHSVEDELQRITDEGNRQHPYMKAEGFTLFQAPALRPECRSAFRLAETGAEQIAGRKTRVFGYVQTEPCALFTYQLGLPLWLEEGRKLHRGQLWLDADTAQLLREERDLFVELASQPKVQVSVMHWVFEYAPSPFGVLVPSAILMESYRYAGGVFNDIADMRLSARVTRRYGPFSRFEVKVEQKVTVPEPPQ